MYLNEMQGIFFFLKSIQLQCYFIEKDSTAPFRPVKLGYFIFFQKKKNLNKPQTHISFFNFLYFPLLFNFLYFPFLMVGNIRLEKSHTQCLGKCNFCKNDIKSYERYSTQHVETSLNFNFRFESCWEIAFIRQNIPSYLENLPHPSSLLPSSAASGEQQAAVLSSLASPNGKLIATLTPNAVSKLTTPLSIK